MARVIAGPLIFPIQIDGEFGPNTERAVKQAQHILGIDEDGIAGPKTLAGLSEFLKTVSPPIDPPHEGEEAAASKEHPAKTRTEAVNRYGAIAGGVWPLEDRWLVYVPVPEDLQHVWIVDGKTPLTRIRCNKDMEKPLIQAMHNIIDRGLAHELKSFDGCFNIRNVRGSSGISCHAYGLAIDINYDGNELGTAGHMSSELVACFTDAGFTWGGNFKSRKDPMHFSFAWE